MSYNDGIEKFKLNRVFFRIMKVILLFKIKKKSNLT